MRPICSSCEVEMQPTNNNVVVVTHANFGPYTLTNADEYTCPKCGHRIITGFALYPYAEHFEEDFKERLEAIKPENIRHNR